MKIKYLVLFSLFCLFLITQVSAQKRLPVVAVSVESGSIINVRDTHRKEIALVIPFIETPSKDQSQMRDLSKKHLEDLLKNKKLEVKVLDIGFGYYNLLYGTLYADGNDVGLQMIRDGAAWHFIPKENTQSPEQQDIYSQNQQQAKLEKLGIWGMNLFSPTELKKSKTEKYQKIISQSKSNGFIHETKAQLVENWKMYETDELRVSELLAVKGLLFNRFNHGLVDLYFILFADKNSYREDSKIKIIADGKEIPLFYTKMTYKERMKGLYQDRYDGIELINGMEFFDFIDLANSKKVTVEIDGKSFDFNQDAFDGFKALSQKIDF